MALEAEANDLTTAACPICGRPAGPDRRYCDSCDFQAEPVNTLPVVVQGASRRAAFRKTGPEVRIFFAVFVLVAITTTMLGVGGPLAIPGLWESLGAVASETSETSWGEVKWVHVPSRVRSDRTTDSPIVGRLAPGDSVRVDFAGAGWYAVFPVAAQDRMETRAIGYVFGKLLKSSPPNELDPQGGDS